MFAGYDIAFLSVEEGATVGKWTQIWQRSELWFIIQTDHFGRAQVGEVNLNTERHICGLVVFSGTCIIPIYGMVQRDHA
jgi:hypothetical protein